MSNSSETEMEPASPDHVTRRRKAFGFICLAVSLGLFLLLGEKVIFTWNYTLILIVWFFVLLSFFHAWFALNPPTPRGVKQIDYWYLGATVVGFILLAAGGENDQKRGAVISTSLSRIFGTIDQDYASILQRDLAFYERVSCVDSTSALLADHCQKARELQADASNEATGHDLENVTNRFLDFQHLRQRATNRSKRDNAQIQADDAATNVEVALKFASYARVLRDWATNSQERSHQVQPNLYLDLAKIIGWSLFVALALALRITKVTIDVFDWARVPTSSALAAPSTLPSSPRPSS